MMFAPHPAAPRIFGLPPGADLAEGLAAGILDRLGPGAAPERLARVTLYLNTQRLRRRLREAFAARGAGLLPRIRLVGELGADPLLCSGGEGVSPLSRRMELAVLIDRLLAHEPALAPRHALHDLAESLAALMDEMRAQAVTPEAVMALDMADHAAHWARTRRFVALVGEFLAAGAAVDTQGRQRLAIEALAAGWRASPPPDPVIVAGSTGSRGTTALLMRAVAALPQGALVLPGFDFALPESAWEAMPPGPEGEDHPQHRYRRLMRDLGIEAGAVAPWADAPAPDPARNRLISLALRPAPVTDQWVDEGPGLGPLEPATKAMTLLEAPDPHREAQAIALALREAAGAGRRATLITPDRALARRVTAALGRWQVTPDDSAGTPLAQTPPGRLLRLVAQAMGTAVTPDRLMMLLRHPLVAKGEGRGRHLALVRTLGLHLRRHGPAFPDAAFLAGWAARQDDSAATPWAEWLGGWLAAAASRKEEAMPALVSRHRELTERLAGGPTGAADSPWQEADGELALAVVAELAAEARAELRLTPVLYARFLDGILAGHDLRETVAADPRIEILGTQEARAQGADLVILGGLNEGVWPAQTGADPWLNRQMRAEVGLLVPERRIGLAAHDFQMAAGAREVVLARALRDAEAPTIPSRWLNRLTNLLAGLSANGGDRALILMRARGSALLARAAALDTPLVHPPAPRPSPRPPVEARPTRLSLTAIERLIRDPYAIYARDVLGLHPLGPLRAEADARLRGEVLHRVPERFLREPLPADPDEAAAQLLRITDEVLAESVPWPAARVIWRARMESLAADFVARLMDERPRPLILEGKAALELTDLGFTLTGRADRIDILPGGRVRAVDYKTGALPTLPQQEAFAKQLRLAAVMIWMGAFPGLGHHENIDTSYVRLAPGLDHVSETLGPDELAAQLDGLRRLIAAYREPGRGYTARRAVFETRSAGDYDDLARFGEWDMTDTPVPADMGTGRTADGGIPGRNGPDGNGEKGGTGGRT